MRSPFYSCWPLASQGWTAALSPHALTTSAGSMQDQWFRQGQGFLVVYSVVNRKSFNEVTPLREKIKRIKDAKTVPMVLVSGPLPHQHRSAQLLYFPTSFLSTSSLLFFDLAQPRQLFCLLLLSPSARSTTLA